MVLNNICGDQDFLWHWTKPHGRSDGILLGVNLEVFDIGSINDRDLYVKFHLRKKTDGFRCVLIAVYGAAQLALKEAFLVELVQTCAKKTYSIVIRDDFNIIRNPEEKNNDKMIGSPFYSILLAWI